MGVKQLINNTIIENKKLPLKYSMWIIIYIICILIIFLTLHVKNTTIYVCA